ncbi:putative membrane protein [Pseudomonas syringae group genomosp. 3]|uniref:Putative membrane protein n=2 Tax=Pseudomonas syringae group TaxID=136849 RepID=A0A2K4WF17_9PSED|nr:putative membrane protein [Pseudomonas syringae group genomosp. 3]SPF18806.1 putative membrane protein [Pseudomonas syringae group genomosp. 3]
MSNFYFKDLSMTFSFLRKVVMVLAYAGLTYSEAR